MNAGSVVNYEVPAPTACGDRFALFANRHLDTPSGLDPGDFELEVSGSNQAINGRVHSNSDMVFSGSTSVSDTASAHLLLRTSGSNYVFEDALSNYFEVTGSNNTWDDNPNFPSTGGNPVQWVTSFAGNTGGGNVFRDGNLQVAGSQVLAPPVAFNVSDYAPGSAKAVAAGSDYHSFVGNKTFTQAELNAGGLWYVNGNVVVSQSTVASNITIVATGTIDMSGSNQDLVSFVDDLLLLSGKVDSSSSFVIKTAGSGNNAGDQNTYDGIIYALGGLIDLSGQWAIYTTMVIGDRVKLAGSNLTFNFNDSLCAPQTGSLEIAKELEEGGASFDENDPLNTFAIDYDCGGAISGTVDVAAGASETVNDIPVGSTCTVSETTPPPPAAPTGYSWSTPTYDPADADSTGVEITTDGQTVTVTVYNELSADTGSLEIAKELEEGGASFDENDPLNTFAIDYDCGGAISGTVDVAAGASETVNDIPVGSTCTVSETTPPPPAAPTGYSWSTPTYDPADADSTGVEITTDGQTVTVTVYNELSADTGSLEIAKELEEGGASFDENDPLNTFAIDYDCGGAISGTVDVAAGASETVNDIPVGSTCTVSETTPPPPAAPTGYSWSTPTYDPADADSTGVEITTDGQTVTVTVYNELSADTGSLEIAKELEEGGASFDENDPLNTFAIDYDCGGAISGTVDVAAGASETVNDIPVGSTCTVSETTPPPPAAPTGYSWSTPTYDPADADSTGVEITTDGQTVTVTVYNELSADTGSLEIAKELEEGGASFDENDPLNTFAIDYDCGGAISGTVDVAAGASETVNDIPVGSTCTVSETTPPPPAAPTGYSWSTPTYDPADADSTGVEITTDGQTVTVTVYNELSADTGSLEIAKELEEGGASFDENDPLNTFAIDYDCGGAISGTVDVAAGASETVNDIPVGSTCTVSETTPPPPAAPTGYSWSTPTYDPADADSTGVEITTDGQTVTVTVYNELSADTETGSLEITKTVDKGTSSFTSGTFSVHVICTDDPNSPYDVSIVFPSPGSVTINGIPTGSECTVSETSTPTPPSGYAWGTPVITGSPATIGLSTTVSVAVANKVWRAALTPGYWKNHKAQALPYLGSIKLGNWPSGSMTWTQATAVFKAMNCSSSKPSDAIGCLAGHLLAAELNVANGADTCIAPSITAADDILKAIDVTPSGTVPYTGPSGNYSKITAAERSLAITIKTILDGYNNGHGCT